MILSFASVLTLFKFLGLITLIALPPGRLLYKWFTNKYSLPYSLPLGLFIITLETYLLGYFGLFKIVPLLILIQGIMLFLLQIRSFRLPSVSVSWVALIAIIVSVTVNSMLLVPFGRLDQSGTSLIGAHFVDSSWHLALIHSLNTSFPPQNPLYAAEPLSNYHYLVDLQISLLSRLSHINIPDLFFRLFGPFYLSLLSVQIYLFAKRLTGKETGGLSALLLIMLTSNLYYLISYFFPHAQLNPSVAWVEFFSSKVVNYPLLVSTSLLFTFMDILLFSHLTKIKSLVLGLLIGALFAIKSHTAVVLIAAVLLVNPLVFLSSLPVVFILSRMIISSPATALQVSPFWFIKTMYESWDHLNTPDWELRRQTLLSLHAYFGIVKLYLQGIFWFMFINFGLLLPGLFALFSPRLNLKTKWFLFSLFGASLGLTMIFIYGSMSIVTIQFIYPVIISLSLLLAFIISRLQKLFSIIISLVIFALLFPGVSYTLKNYHSSSPNISGSLIQASRYLSSLPDGAVVVGPEFWSGSIIPAFSNHPVYTGDIQILDSLGINYSTRQKESRAALGCLSFPTGASYIISSVPLNCYRHLYSSGNYHLYAF